MCCHFQQSGVSFAFGSFAFGAIELTSHPSRFLAFETPFVCSVQLGPPLCEHDGIQKWDAQVQAFSVLLLPVLAAAAALPHLPLLLLPVLAAAVAVCSCCSTRTALSAHTALLLVHSCCSTRTALLALLCSHCSACAALLALLCSCHSPLCWCCSARTAPLCCSTLLLFKIEFPVCVLSQFQCQSCELSQVLALAKVVCCGAPHCLLHLRAGNKPPDQWSLLIRAPWGVQHCNSNGGNACTAIWPELGPPTVAPVRLVCITPMQVQSLFTAIQTAKANHQ